jgi:tetratricopeptide (TPR) repeat protein
VAADLETIKRAVGRVLLPAAGADIRLGTAFFIGGKFVVTALHVVADVRGARPAFHDGLLLEFGTHRTPARIVDEFWDARGDWAVLECTIPPPVSPVGRRSGLKVGDAWDAFAYPDIQPEGKTLKGDVRDPKARFRSTGAIELFCADAAAGAGARLHGASGAPCLVDGAAVGLLRSTLVETLLDGEGRPQVFTQAGAVYACPATAIVEWQADRARPILPETWAPSQVVTSDFIVFLSQAEEDSTAYGLRPTVERVFELVGETGLSAPSFESAADMVASEDNLLDAVRAMCHARVVVFDATGFEPAIMLLAGIRAVVRRGVTILSIGGHYALGSQLDVPFNVTDANVVAHSEEQDKSAKTSVELLEERLRGGLQEVQSPYYLDLPVYDALRRLPPDRRGIIASEEGVLVLCSFHPDYLKAAWETVRRGLEHQHNRLRRERRADGADGAQLGVARSLDISSARLVSQALFETIRRAQSCVADLTRWPSNVLFELGVRLAASGERTACLIQSEWEGSVTPSWLAQCRSLVSLLVPTAHRYSLKRHWNKEPAFEKVYGPVAIAGQGILAGSVHATVERALDIRSEPTARPVYRELLDSAELFSRTPGKGGRSKPVGLYPGHLELPAKEEEAEFERLLAAWYYLNHRYRTEERESISARVDAAAGIAQSIFQRHSQRLGGLPDVEVAEIRRVARVAAIAAPRPTTLDEIRSVKLWAIAMRNQGEFDAAMKLLDDARSALERMVDDPALDPRSAADIRVELADTFGMKGGVYRRQGKLHDAYQEYKRGEQFEKVDQQSTYNLSNVIALGVTEERVSPLAPDMRQSIEQAIAQLVRKTSGTRTDEWWAWSDLGQLYLLYGDAVRAAEAYERARKTGPTAEEYDRHVVMLNKLRTVMSETAPDLVRGIDRMLTELSSPLT